jgi:hypothetical protein
MVFLMLLFSALSCIVFAALFFSLASAHCLIVMFLTLPGLLLDVDTLVFALMAVTRVPLLALWVFLVDLVIIAARVHALLFLQLLLICKVLPTVGLSLTSLKCFCILA